MRLAKFESEELQALISHWNSRAHLVFLKIHSSYRRSAAKDMLSSAHEGNKLSGLQVVTYDWCVGATAKGPMARSTSGPGRVMQVSSLCRPNNDRFKPASSKLLHSFSLSLFKQCDCGKWTLSVDLKVCVYTRMCQDLSQPVCGTMRLMYGSPLPHWPMVTIPWSLSLFTYIIQSRDYFPHSSLPFISLSQDVPIHLIARIYPLTSLPYTKQLTARTMAEISEPPVPRDAMLYEYSEGNTITLKLSKSTIFRPTVQAHIIPTFKPFTCSSVMVVEVPTRYCQTQQAILKFYDQRFCTDLRKYTTLRQ